MGLVVLGLFVRGDVALVVAQHDLVVRVADEVVGHDRDLAAAAGSIHHVRRHRIAGSVAAQPFHDLDPLADRGAEMARALDQVALVDVVGPDAVLDQPMNERPHDVDAVVDPGEQYRLIAERDAGAGDPVGGAGDFGRDLVGMVEMEVHPKRVVLGEHVAQLVVDALRQEDRHARSDADDLDVRDLAQAAQDRLEQLGV